MIGTSCHSNSGRVTPMSFPYAPRSSLVSHTSTTPSGREDEEGWVHTHARTHTHTHTHTRESLFCPLHDVLQWIAPKAATSMLGLAVSAVVETACVDGDDLHQWVAANLG